MSEVKDSSDIKFTQSSLVKLIVHKNGEPMPDLNHRTYSGNLEEIPSSISNISDSVTIPHLQ